MSVSTNRADPNGGRFMKVRLLSLPLLLFLAAPAGAEEKKEIDKFQGVWNAESVVYGGKDFYAGGQAKIRFVIKDDQVTVEGNDAVKKEYGKFTIKPDPTTTPPLIDIKITGGTQQDSAIEGIYEIKGDELKICARVMGNERPTKFESPDGSGVVLVVLKREKP
jgi:uncharacterized protein (TIGR03067 family)